MSDESWIVLGATSGIARPFARLLAERGAHLILAGRDMAELAILAADARSRGGSAEVVAIDMRDPGSFAAARDAGIARPGTLNLAVFTGSMPPQAGIDADPSLIEGVVADSFTGPARFLSGLAPELERRGRGTVVGLSSVAGDRGRLGNYVYGAAKAGFTAYLSGLRNRLARSGVHVLTVKPGPVDTAMTWGQKMPLMTTPEAAARAILRAADDKRNVIYTAGIWRLVMLVVRGIPEPLFKRMKI